MRRTYLSDYGKYEGIDADQFDNATANEEIACACECGEVEGVRKRNIVDRIKRGADKHLCRTCVNTSTAKRKRK